MDLLHLVDRLEELIAEAQKMPIGNRVIIDRRRLLDLIDQMRISVPQEVREARELVADRDRVLRDAEEDARLTVARAEETASHLVDDHTVTAAARERAQEIADEAELRLTQRVEQANDDIQVRIEESRDLARQQMQAADDYAAELLHRLDRQLQAFVGSVQSGIQQVQPERELPPAPYPGEFDPGPPAPGNFRSDDALGSLPEDERQTDDLALTRHQLPDTPVPAVSLPEPEPAPEPAPEPEPAPVVMSEEEPEAPPPAAVDEPPAIEEAPAPTPRFGTSVWGRSTAVDPEPESPVTEEPATEEPAAARTGFASSIWGRSTTEEPAAEVEPGPAPVEAADEPEQLVASIEPLDEAAGAGAPTSQTPAAELGSEDEVEPEPEPGTGGGGPFSSLFSRPAAEEPPAPPPSGGATSSSDSSSSSSGSDLPGDRGRLPSAGAVPPPTPTGSRFGFFGRRDQPAASVDTDVAPAVEPSDANGNTFEQPAVSDGPSASTGFAAGLDRAATPDGEFEDLLAQARESADPLPDSLPEDLIDDETTDSGDQPAAVIDDFDNPPLDDDPLHDDASDGGDRSNQDRDN